LLDDVFACFHRLLREVGVVVRGEQVHNYESWQMMKVTNSVKCVQ
jgi:hypothetical protein